MILFQTLHETPSDEKHFFFAKKNEAGTLLCPLLVWECCALQMPAGVSRGGAQLSAGPRSCGLLREGWREGPGMLGWARHLPDSPERPASLSHLLLMDAERGDGLRGPSGRVEDARGRADVSF